MIKEKQTLKGGSSSLAPNLDNCTDFDISKIKPLVGSVEPYDRHYFVYTDNNKLTADISSSSIFIQELLKAYREVRKQISQHIKISGIAGGTTKGPATDILVFPEKFRYVDVTALDIPEIISDMKNNTISKKIKN